MKKQGVFMAEMAADSTEATIDIVGVIGWEVAFTELRRMFGTFSDAVKRVTFNIYSPGGDVWDGNGIVQAIGELGKTRETVARVQVAASMATLIAVACQKRSIAANGRFLIHNAWTVTQGDAADHEKAAQTLRDCENEAVKFYSARTGKPEAEIRALMNDERWMTPTEAKDMGFVQEIDDPFDQQAVAAVRAEIEAAGKWPQALVEIPPEGGSNGSTTDNGTEGNAGAAPIVPPIAAMPDVAAIEAARTAGYAAGKDAADSAILARAQAGENRVLALTAEISALTGKLDASIAEGRKLQGERDQARAMAERNKTALDEATAKITRLLSGGLTFSPSVETWEQALKACNGDYVKARNQFPDVYRARRENDKANRK
jgi:ATP-dependent Clp protease protease subunit